MTMKLSNPEAWKSLWEDVLDNDVRRQRKADAPESIERWNGRAKSFAQNAIAPSSQTKVDELLGWLSQNGAIKEGFKVLDIGAGSGRYALPMAKMGCDVTALEPAPSMVEHMRERMAQENVRNITILNKPWQAVELEQDSMLGQYDLVFASMTPGIQRPDDLLKMIKASRKACYLSSHTRDRWHHLEKVWKDVFERDMPELPGDFMYRFGFVYALGYVPITRHVKGTGSKAAGKSKEKIKEDIIWSLSNYIEKSELPDEAQVKIDAYVDALDPEAEAASGRNMSSVSMLWFVE